MQVRMHSRIQATQEDSAFQTQHSYVTAQNKYIECEIATIKFKMTLLAFI